MKLPTKSMGERYIAAWRKASVVLQERRAQELPMVDTTQGLLSLLPAFNACVRERPPANSSGLIEQQRIFSRARGQ